MPILEASPGPQGGRHRLQWVSLATQGPKVAGATPLPGEEVGPSSHTSWSGLSVHTASQTLAGTGPWTGLTGQSRGGRGRAGIHGEATTGVPRLASPHCPDLAWLLWPLRPLLRALIRLEPLCPSVRGITTPWFSSMLLGRLPLVLSLFLPLECGDSLGLAWATAPQTLRTHLKARPLPTLKPLHLQQPRARHLLWLPPLFSFF